MTLPNPSQALKTQLPALLATLQQAAQQDPESLDIDMGQAQQVHDALSNIIGAKQGGGQGGQQGKQGQQGQQQGQEGQKGQQGQQDKSSSMGPDEPGGDPGEKQDSGNGDDDKSESDKSSQKKSQIIP